MLRLALDSLEQTYNTAVRGSVMAGLLPVGLSVCSMSLAHCGMLVPQVLVSTEKVQCTRVSGGFYGNRHPAKSPLPHSDPKT